METNNRLDKLFADKLQTHEAPAPAWERVVAGLPGSSFRPWWQQTPAKAAAVLLLGGLGFGVYQANLTNRELTAESRPAVVKPLEKGSEALPVPPPQLAEQKQSSSKIEAKPPVRDTQSAPKPLPKVKSLPTEAPLLTTNAPTLELVPHKTVGEEPLKTSTQERDAVAVNRSEETNIPVSNAVVVVEAEAEETIASRPESRLKKLTNKLLHIKRGEFKEAGIDPREVVALVRHKSDRP